MVVQPPAPEENKVDGADQSQRKSPVPTAKAEDNCKHAKQDPDIRPAEWNGIRKPTGDMRNGRKHAAGIDTFDQAGRERHGPRAQRSDNCKAGQDNCDRKFTLDPRNDHRLRSNLRSKIFASKSSIIK